MPDTIDVQRNLGTQLMRAGNYRRAVEVFRKVLAKQPGDTESLRGIAQSLLKLGESTDAIRYLEPLAADPARRELGDLLSLGNLYLKANRKADALKVANAMGVSPSGAKSEDMLDLGNLWLDVGNGAKARSILRRLPPAVQNGQRGRELDADSTAALGEHDKAAELYLKLTGPERNVLEFAWRYAEELDLAGDKGQAFAEVKRLLPRGSTTVPQLVFAAQLALDQKDIGLAERVVAKIPDSIRTLDVELVRAEVKIARGDYLDAEVILERAFAAYPDTTELRRVYAPVLLELGSFERALSVLKPLLGRGAAVGDLKVASQIYRALGREDDREATYLRLVAGAPADVDAALDLADFLVGELAGKHAIAILRDLKPAGENRLVAMAIHGGALLTMHATDAAVLGAIEPLWRKPELPWPVAVRLADLMLDLGYPTKALNAFAKTPKTQPPARALVLRARALFRARADRERALTPAMQAMARLGEGPPVQEIFELAEVLNEIRAPELAIKVLDFQRPPQIRQFTFDLLRARVLYLSLADVESAEKLLRQLVRYKSPNLLLDLDLASLLLEIHEVDLAIRFLDSLRPTPEYVLRHGLLRASASLRSREGRQRALTRLNELEREVGVDPAQTVDFAETLLEVPDRPRAIKLLMTLDPPKRLAFRHKILMAQAFTKVNDFKAVEEILGTVKDELKTGPEKKGAAIELALGLKETRAAEVMFAQLPEWWLDTHEGRRLIVNMDIARGRFDHALRVSRRLVRDRPADPNELNLQAQAHIGVREYCEAEAIFDDLIKLIPDKEEFILGRSQALRGLERNAEALRPHVELVERYDRLGETPPIDFIIEAAECLDENKYRASAKDYYQRAMKFRPDDPDYKKALAGTLSRLDLHQEAYSMFKDGAYRKPEKDDQVAAAGYLRELGSPERAKEEYEEALRRDPDDLDAKRGLASVLAERDATRRRGVALYRQILAVKPDDHQTRALLASALARDKFYDEADFELEHTHVKKPRDRETRRVRSTLDIVHGYPNVSEKHQVNLKYQERSDPEAEIGLADVAANRGKGYLTDEVSHVLAAKIIAPRRRAVVRRQELLFLPLAEVDTVREAGSDTLERDTDTVRVVRLLQQNKEGELSLQRKAVRRRGIEVTGADANAFLLWNFRPGATINGGVTVGELGDDLDVLPKLELRYKDLHGVEVGGDYLRLRIDDSPDALLAGLRSETFRFILGKELGPIFTELQFRQDNITDGNKRRSIISLLRYRVVPRFDINFELQARNARRLPQPFDLYFAPLDYQLLQLGFEYRSVRSYGFEYLFGASALADRLDEDRGTGFRVRGRVERAMGPLAVAFLGGEYLSTSATRRLGLDQAFNNTTIQAGYSTRF